MHRKQIQNHVRDSLTGIKGANVSFTKDEVSLTGLSNVVTAAHDALIRIGCKLKHIKGNVRTYSYPANKAA
jgi:predicted nucleic-acid-binding Zn-ribbon protein